MKVLFYLISNIIIAIRTTLDGSIRNKLLVLVAGAISHHTFKRKNAQMNINATFAGQIIFTNFLVMLYLALKVAKEKSDNLPLVGFYTFLLSFLFFPASWLYCWYWSKRSLK